MAKRSNYTKKNSEKLDKSEDKLKKFFLDFIEKTGTLPWHSSVVKGSIENPSRGISKVYEGFNALITYMARILYKYDSDTFLTLPQVNKRGGRVKAGEKGVPVVKPIFRDYDKDGNKLTKEQADVLRASGERVTTKFVAWAGWTVFNLAQTTLEYEHLEVNIANEQNASAQAIVDGFKSGPKIVFDINLGKADGFYTPSSDEVHVGPSGAYASMSDFYLALFHELVHSTEHRMGLKNGTKGSMTYLKRELRAEVGGSLLMSLTDLPPVLENSASYIKGWISKLKGIEDFTNVMTNTFSSARNAVDYILSDGQTNKEVA